MAYFYRAPSRLNKGKFQLPLSVAQAQGQGNYLVLIRNTVRALRSGHHEVTQNNHEDCNDEPGSRHLIRQSCKPSHAVSRAYCGVSLK
jgi:hypothetical protein